MENYSATIEIDSTASQAFDALTNRISLWWTELFEGSANNESDHFTVRFGGGVFKIIEVKEQIYPSKLVWEVKDSLIDLPVLKNKSEWKGTTIKWDLTPYEKRLQLRLTHVGLHPGIECFDICKMGWQQFTHSLQSLLETGQGKPFRSTHINSKNDF
ncbi:SRPBCC domain-containing protein [Niabella insulamsoli]|uniref:SRPBCC family protein n=1 Tax=Niabella insulamsoli TaxID=3144874 RepID=UPI0031FDED4E